MITQQYAEVDSFLLNPLSFHLGVLNEREVLKEEEKHGIMTTAQNLVFANEALEDALLPIYQIKNCFCCRVPDMITISYASLFVGKPRLRMGGKSRLRYSCQANLT